MADMGVLCSSQSSQSSHLRSFLAGRSGNVGRACHLPASISVEAVPGCPAREELLDELDRRVDPAWRSGFDRRRFDVRIERLPEPPRGRGQPPDLSLFGRGPMSGRRHALRAAGRRHFMQTASTLLPSGSRTNAA